MTKRIEEQQPVMSNEGINIAGIDPTISRLQGARHKQEWRTLACDTHGQRPATGHERRILDTRHRCLLGTTHYIMKQVACATVVDGCDGVVSGATETEALAGSRSTRRRGPRDDRGLTRRRIGDSSRHYRRLT